MEEDRKAKWIRDTIITAGILAVACMYVKSLVHQTEDAVAGRKFWMYPIVLAQWLIVGPILLFVAFVAAMLIGYGLDYGLFLGIDQMGLGNFGAAAGWIIAWIVISLVITGWMYEQLRPKTPTLTWKSRLLVVGTIQLVLTLCGSVPYIHAAVTGGLPVFHM